MLYIYNYCSTILLLLCCFLYQFHSDKTRRKQISVTVKHTILLLSALIQSKVHHLVFLASWSLALSFLHNYLYFSSVPARHSSWEKSWLSIKGIKNVGTFFPWPMQIYLFYFLLQQEDSTALTRAGTFRVFAHDSHPHPVGVDVWMFFSC